MVWRCGIMGFCLGNYDIGRMEKRLGITFPEELVTYMNERHQDNAGRLEKDRWHCFDIPFVLHCENIEMATKIYDYLKPFSNEMKDQLRITTQSWDK
jgi:hypothetical protein